MFRCVFSEEPLLLYTGLGTLRQLAKDDRKRPEATLLTAVQELLYPQQCAKIYAAAKNRHPNFDILILGNTPEFVEQASRMGLPAFFCHHNVFLDERVFRPVNTPKVVDAIYIARVLEDKRHALASRIRKWYWITDRYLLEKNMDLYRKIRDIPGIVPANPLFPDGTPRRLSRDLVNLRINEAGVGLCLSQRERGQFAATEQQLAGLPVVATPTDSPYSGRDYFFDPRHTSIVPPDSEAVARAVRELIEKRLDPQEVRESVLAKMRPIRERFLDKVQELCDSLGADIDFRTDVWPRVYKDRLRAEEIPDLNAMFAARA